MQPFNILRYQVGQHYDSHYDVFEPESYGPQNSQRVSSLTGSLRLHIRACFQSLSLPAVCGLTRRRVQMATVLFYLTDVEEGGETVFPLEGKHGMDRLPHIDYRSCKDGYKVRQCRILGLGSMDPRLEMRLTSMSAVCSTRPGKEMLWRSSQCTRTGHLTSMHCMEGALSSRARRW